MFIIKRAGQSNIIINNFKNIKLKIPKWRWIHHSKLSPNLNLTLTLTLTLRKNSPLLRQRLNPFSSQSTKLWNHCSSRDLTTQAWMMSLISPLALSQNCSKGIITPLSKPAVHPVCPCQTLILISSAWAMTVTELQSARPDFLSRTSQKLSVPILK